MKRAQGGLGCGDSRLAVGVAACILVFAGAARGIEGTGYGASEDAARQTAAADLAGAIQVQVKAAVESCKRVVGKQAEDCGSRVVNRTATDLPLLGLSYQRLPGGSEAFGAKAVLDAQTSAPLYQEVLDRLGKEYVGHNGALAAASERRQRYEIIGRQLATLRAIQDHRLVATALGLKTAEPPASEAALMAAREKLEESADSLAYAAKLLLKDLIGTVVAAEPLRPESSREATPFGSALADALRAEINGRGGPPMRLSGEYRLLDNGAADVVLEIRDAASNGIAGVRSVRLQKAGYAGYRATPLAPDFEKLLRQGEAISGDLRAELVTTVGAQTLQFKAGETLKLAARLNRAAYFYVVGHVVRPDGQFSYLLPVSEGGEGEAQFVRRVPADQANHYIEIGEFTVEPPYGTEHLQIIASVQPPKGALPPYEHDTTSGYFKIKGSNGNAKAGLAKTRGLKPKAPAKTEGAVAEGTLTFTTVAK
jgi:hypothetical protein